MKDEGYLDSRVGKGVFVLDRQPFVIDAAAYITPEPGRFRYQLLTVDNIVPPADIVDGLQLAPGATAIIRTRILFHAGQPVELSASYYPAEIAANSSLAKAAKIRGGAPQALADDYPAAAWKQQKGHPPSEWPFNLRCRPSTQGHPHGSEF